MSATSRRTVIVLLAALAGAVVLAWSAASGPAELATAPVAPEDTAGGPAVVAPDDVPSKDASDSRDDESQAGDTNPAWLVDIAGVAVLLVGLWVLSLLVRLVLARLPGRQLVLDLEPLPRPDTGHDAVQHREEQLRDALTVSDVRNGIVACWALLEDAAAEAGVPRVPSETATELVVRFLHALDVDPRPVATLAGLFHEARFSTHPLTEEHTRAARHALDDILGDVARARIGAS